MYYKLFGEDIDKDYIILLHGIGGSSTVWFKQLKELKKLFNVILVDLPGHGKASKVKEKYNDKYKLENIVEDMILLFNELEEKYSIKSFHLMGVSLGTIIIHEILKIEDVNKKIKSIIQVGSVIKFNIVCKIFIGIGKKLIKFLPIKFLYPFMAYVLLPYSNHRKSRDMFIQEAKKVKESEFRKWYWILDDVESAYDDSIKNLNIDKLYISGNQDVMFIGELKKCIIGDRKANLEIINNAGHICNIDKSDEFNKILRDYYNK